MQPHDFWQELHPPKSFPTSGEFRDVYVAELPDGRQLRLPIRMLADGEHALASLIINQAGFSVQEALAQALAERIAAYDIDVVAGLPTLGLTLASAVARALGHDRYVPLGTSRKFWYREELSVPLSSITTPNQEKRLYVDPRMLPLLEGKRVALIDDVISSGASIVSGLELLSACAIEPVVIGAAMLQSERWREQVDASGTTWSERIVGVFSTPILDRTENGGWRRP
ncbi:phosphoribosyltransferase [Agrobacterium sp. SHOUNA12C]|uniref:Purine/pyrimidine phosphoribosyltransferase protein n=2 Tax=Rhizobium rhizogenes TaxID=359 RepID=B9JGX0_RHIR8|nr:phosphoribosyltransferase [Rhizobium rhizogenes]ACM24966.1 purine/pyrimidine phosphoribosyltransferase protein [Rhizobium rhizogenes K84]KAA6475560.1 phosphoribosyltransferase [Agrobacterium sp. ICMP 7243]MCJ9724560.1 phosphoribosyltransferase [Agrobacterium sp. BETTINA12B]MCJ9760094.1 phosphoribosyltransferase [Agrobacterium sp. SHOUNA12C]OCJ03491.1 phosphoribosyltransferase [Agrobacterium sp. 13-626]OCJ27854.1 phosphoribosyltransferase [Agrobacterium sp. B133/95]